MLHTVLCQESCSGWGCAEGLTQALSSQGQLGDMRSTMTRNDPKELWQQACRRDDMAVLRLF